MVSGVDPNRNSACKEKRHGVLLITATTADALLKSSHSNTASLLLQRCVQVSLEIQHDPQGRGHPNALTIPRGPAGNWGENGCIGAVGETGVCQPPKLFATGPAGLQGRFRSIQGAIKPPRTRALKPVLQDSFGIWQTWMSLKAQLTARQ